VRDLPRRRAAQSCTASARLGPARHVVLWHGDEACFSLSLSRATKLGGTELGGLRRSVVATEQLRSEAGRDRSARGPIGNERGGTRRSIEGGEREREEKDRVR